MSIPEALLIFIAGALASAINSVAGGGTLITFPFLTLSWGVGLPITVANATNAVGLWPGSLAGAYGFRNLLHKTRHYISWLIVPTVLGAASGAELFVITPKGTFEIIVPFLILLASVLLVSQRRIKEWVVGGGRKVSPITAATIQFFVALYGGYFGAGIGIMMLAVFALYMDGTLHEINAIKTLMGLVVNLIASMLFVIHSLIQHEMLVNFPVGGMLAFGSIVGGFYSAKFSQKVDPDKLRIAIAAYGLMAAAYYLVKALHFI